MKRRKKKIIRNPVVRNPVVAMIMASADVRVRLIEECRKTGGPTLSQQAISQWPRLKKGVPPERVQVVSRVLGIPPHEIRPDIFSPSIVPGE